MIFRALAPAGTHIPLGCLLEAVTAPLKGGHYTELFGKAVRLYFGTKYCRFASSGRAALTLLLSAMKRARPERDTVAIPAFTSFSVPSAVVKAGLKVALYDVDPYTLSADLGSLKEAIDDSTLSVVICHLFGYPCDVDPIISMARAGGAFVIDDAAQAMGARYKERPVGAFGDAGIFSLNRGKGITTAGGGFIITDSAGLATELLNMEPERGNCIYGMRAFFEAVAMDILLHPNLYWITANMPFLGLGASVFSTDFPIMKYTEAQAAIGEGLFRQLEAINKNRTITALKLSENLDGCEGISRIAVIDRAEPVYLRLPVKLNTEPGAEARQYGITRSYPSPLSEIGHLKAHLGAKRDGFAGAESLSRNLWTLPTHAYVTDGDIGAICKILRKGPHGKQS